MRVLKGRTDLLDPRTGKGGVTRNSLLLTTMAVVVLAACTGAGDGRGGAATPHGSASVPPGVRPHTTVGVIRWDLWSEHNQSNSLVVGLSQPRWRYRLPFYATNLGDEIVTIREDRQSVMNQEIGYASSAGIDYWAFDFYDPNGIGSRPMHMNYGVELFKASSLNDRMRYALITTDGTTPKAWPSYSDALVSNFTHPRYQKVAGGRPLLYLFDVDGLGYTRAQIDSLRSKAAAARLPQPYIVAMVWDPQAGVRAIDRLGLDAMGSYLLGPDPEGRHPYSDQARADREFWEACRSTGRQVVPLVVASHDTRPGWEYPPPWQTSTSGPWYEEPTLPELEGHLEEAFRWNAANAASTSADTILIYSWNETAEGGFNIVPTHAEGAARLDAIRPVIARWTSSFPSDP